MWSWISYFSFVLLLRPKRAISEDRTYIILNWGTYVCAHTCTDNNVEYDSLCTCTVIMKLV